MLGFGVFLLFPPALLLEIPLLNGLETFGYMAI
jgi:hypothetical protein